MLLSSCINAVLSGEEQSTRTISSLELHKGAEPGPGGCSKVRGHGALTNKRATQWHSQQKMLSPEALQAQATATGNKHVCDKCDIWTNDRVSIITICSYHTNMTPVGEVAETEDSINGIKKLSTVALRQSIVAEVAFGWNGTLGTDVASIAIRLFRAASAIALWELMTSKYSWRPSEFSCW